MAGPMVTVRKHDWHGRFRYAWQGLLLERTPDYLVLDAVWQGPGEPRVGAVQFNLGDRFLEYYYPERPYAIWQVERPDGGVKGWYCNIGSPLREDGDTLSFDDLLLDVLVYPDGRYEVLDEDEYATARTEGLPDLQIQQATTGLAAVLAQIEACTPPFAFSGPARQVGIEGRCRVEQ